MKCYVLANGEPTLDTCVWSLERNGWEVIVYNDQTTLWAKLKRLYFEADDGFARVDADVIINNSFRPENLILPVDVWWTQYLTFDWYKQNLTVGGAHVIGYEALDALRDNIEKFEKAERPESQMFRLDEFHHPRRCTTTSQVMGIHGFGIKDFEYVYETKRRRKQDAQYDWELTHKLNEFLK